MSSPRRYPSIVLVALGMLGACAKPSAPVSSLHAITGSYDGRIITGQVMWTVQQNGDQITGNGTFTSAKDGGQAVYTIRGTLRSLTLSVRLVGAPGDSDADSVWYSGRPLNEDYVGTVFNGMVYGHSATMYGPLALYLRGS